MGKNRDQESYLNGMAFALRIAKESGIEGLEKEIEFRGLCDVPLNVKKSHLVVAAQEIDRYERMLVATASAKALMDGLHMPPSMVAVYLKHFNDNVNRYEKNKEQLEKDSDYMNNHIGLNQVCKEFVEKRDGK